MFVSFKNSPSKTPPRPGAPDSSVRESNYKTTELARLFVGQLRRGFAGCLSRVQPSKSLSSHSLGASADHCVKLSSSDHILRADLRRDLGRLSLSEKVAFKNEVHHYQRVQHSLEKKMKPFRPELSLSVEQLHRILHHRQGVAVVKSQSPSEYINNIKDCLGQAGKAIILYQNTHAPEGKKYLAIVHKVEHNHCFEILDPYSELTLWVGPNDLVKVNPPYTFLQYFPSQVQSADVLQELRNLS